MEPTYSTTPKNQETIAALWRLLKVILDTLDFNNVVQKIVESTLTELGYLNLGYRVIVLALIDKKEKKLKRISFSRTKEGIEAIRSLSIPFAKIDIPLTETKNLCIQSMEQKQPLITHDVADVFYPALPQEEIAIIQKVVGIKTTMVYPVISRGEPMGVLIFSMVKSEQEVSSEEKDLIAGFTDIVGLAVQNAKLYSSIQEESKQLEIANERLKSIDKLKDEFVSLASHELRTPMTAISSYIWLVKKDPNLTDLQRNYLENTYSSVQRLIRLVNDMLSVSRIETGRLIIKPQPVNIEQVVQETLTELLPKAQEEKITLTEEKPALPLPNVLIDKDKIKEVLMNLVGNSLKFTPAGGTITISFSEHDSMVEVHIKDTGAGIKKEDIPKLFRKFGMIEDNYLKTTPGQGTGLGLYISKSIIQLHGGSIWFESDGENKGTTFSFSLKKA